MLTIARERDLVLYLPFFKAGSRVKVRTVVANGFNNFTAVIFRVTRGTRDGVL